MSLGPNQYSKDPFGILDGYIKSEAWPEVEEDKRTVANCMECFSKAEEARRLYESDWEFFRLYLKGEAVARHRETGEIVRVSSEDSKRLYSVNNVLRNTARSYVGKLTRAIPTCVTLPATSDVAEQSAVEVADTFLQAFRRQAQLDIKYIELIEYLPWAGTGILKLEWDPLGGREVASCGLCGYYTYDMENDAQPCPACSMQREQEDLLIVREQTEANLQGIEVLKAAGQTGQDPSPALDQIPSPQRRSLGPLGPNEEIPTLFAANEGGLRAIVIDPREFYVSPGARTLAEATWVCWRRPLPVPALRSRFPRFAKFIHAESETNGEWIHSEIGFEGDYAWLYEFHEKSTGMYPRGRQISIVNGHVVEEIESPYLSLLERFPFYIFRAEINKGEFWGEGPIAQAWHRQKEINRVETQIREHVELLLKPKLFTPLGSRIAADEFTAATGQVIQFSPVAGTPDFKTPPPLPVGVFQRGAQLEANVRSHFAITDQEAGLSPTDPNGRAMAIIEAEADQQTRAIIVKINEEWREFHKGALILTQAFYRAERKFTIAGPDGAQTFSFDEMRLIEGWDIQVEEEDGLSRNPAIRLQQAGELANLGLFMGVDSATGMPTQVDKKAFARTAKLKTITGGVDDEKIERARAREVPYKVVRGEHIEPHLWDIPHIFAEELLSWLRGPGARAEAQQVDQVAQIWQFYTQWAMTGQANPGLLPQAGGGPEGPQSGGGSPMGGSRPGPGGMPAASQRQAGGGSVQGDAQGTVASANAQAEQAGEAAGGGRRS